jgi:hypothetical protein
VGDHTLVVNPIVEFGYLTVTTDAKTLTITFKVAISKQQVMQRDSVTVDLKSGKITSDRSGVPTNPLPAPKKPKKGKGGGAPVGPKTPNPKRGKKK